MAMPVSVTEAAAAVVAAETEEAQLAPLPSCLVMKPLQQQASSALFAWVEMLVASTLTTPMASTHSILVMLYFLHLSKYLWQFISS